MPRQNETITLSAAFIKSLLKNDSVNAIQIKDLKNNSFITSQGIDYDGDGQMDDYIFQDDFEVNEQKEYALSVIEHDNASSSKVYATYMGIGEGMQDFTWENDRIGYRFYGQERAEKQQTGIAMDVWCKRFPEFLTDKWYAPSQNYHIDKGYGADHYNSGKNQGCGGTGIIKNDSILFSQAFSKWKIIANGPIRTVFELEFTGWSIDPNIVETKRVTLDAGHYFNKIESRYNQNISLLGYEHAVGFVQRDDSINEVKQKSGWLANWESLGEENGNLGTGFIALPIKIIDIKNLNDHIVCILQTKPVTEISYYTGAAWDEFGPVHSKKEWFSFVKDKAFLIENPCMVSVSKQ